MNTPAVGGEHAAELVARLEGRHDAVEAERGGRSQPSVCAMAEQMTVAACENQQIRPTGTNVLPADVVAAKPQYSSNPGRGASMAGVQ